MISNPESINTNDEDIAYLRRYVFIIELLDSAREAGLTPIPILRLHTFAYLANVLAPMWNLPSLDGKILKRKGSPFYPLLQQDLDRMVGMGMVYIQDISHVLDRDNKWRLEGAVELNYELSSEAIKCISLFRDERERLVFLQELAYALTALDDEQIDLATTEDATYSDPVTGVGNVVDFAEWQHQNFSVNAANTIKVLADNKSQLTPGEVLHLYIRHIEKRLRGER